MSDVLTKEELLKRINNLEKFIDNHPPTPIVVDSPPNVENMEALTSACSEAMKHAFGKALIDRLQSNVTEEDTGATIFGRMIRELLQLKDVCTELKTEDSLAGSVAFLLKLYLDEFAAALLPYMDELQDKED